ncbi:MAG: hypothetical protein RL437_135 [Actinomycetota bacterium]
MLEFYKDKKLLLTGHTGFKGAWLARILVNVGAKVHGISLPAERNSIFEKTGNFGLESDLVLDIRNREELRNYLKNQKFDGVFHLAAQPLVRKSYVEPVETFNTNVMGTIHLLDALLTNNCTPWVVAITTDKVYHNVEKLEGYKESEPLGGKDPYSASKAAAEIAIAAWQNLADIKNGMRIVSARAGNVIGGGDHAEDRLLPDLVRGFKSGEKTIIRNPESLRPWQHVLDPLNGYLKLGFKLSNSKVSNAYNFGPNEKSKLNVEKMSQIACNYWPNNAGYKIEKSEANPPESNLLWLDSSKAKKELSWETKLDAEEAIKWTINWELEAANSSPLNALDKQISMFFEGATL